MRGDRREQTYGLIPPPARALRGAQIARVVSLFVFIASSFAPATGQVGPDAPKRSIPAPAGPVANKPPATKAPPAKASPTTKAPPAKAPPMTKAPPRKLPPRRIESKDEVLRTLRNSFIRVPAGEFMMGSTNGHDSERPVHRVRISRVFEMGKYETTQAQWQFLLGSNPSQFKGASLPVERVSWEDVQQFIQKLNALNDGYIYRLPTEAEWEYACRAGSTGDYAGSLDAMAWYGSNAVGTTHPVGQKEPNAWGLYDMHGNVREWCQDWFNVSYYAQSPSVDPIGPRAGSDRVLRGGNWILGSDPLRSAHRWRMMPALREENVGFRLVRTTR